MLLYQLHQTRRILFRSGFRQHQRGTSKEPPEQFPDRNIKGNRRLLQNDVFRPKLEDPLHPGQTVDNAPLLNNHTLRGTGGTGGMDDIGCGTRRSALRQGIAGEIIHLLNQKCFCSAFSKQPGQFAASHDIGGFRVFKNKPQAFGGKMRIQRHIGAARLEYSQYRRRKCNAPVEKHADKFSTVFGKRMGYPVGEGIELPVCERFLFITHRDAVRRSLNLFRKNVCEDLVLRKINAGLVEAVHHLPEFRFIGQIKTGNHHVGIVQGAFQQMAEPLQDPLCPGRIRKAAPVGQAQAGLFARHHGERQRIVRRLQTACIFDAEGALARGFVHRIVFIDQQRFKEWTPLDHFRLRLNPVKRRPLVLLAFRLKNVQIPSQLSEGLSGQLQTHRHGVDKHPDHPLHIRDIRMTAGHHRAKHHVVCTAHLRKQQSPQRMEEGAQCHIQGQGKSRKTPGKFGRKCQSLFPKAFFGMNFRKFQWRRLLKTAQNLPPPAQRALLITPAEPFGVVGKTRRRGKRLLFVDLCNIRHQQRQRPAIQCQMVVVQDNPPLPLFLPEDRKPQKRCLHQIEAALSVFIQESFKSLVEILAGITPVFDTAFERGIPEHHGVVALTLREGQTQRRMTPQRPAESLRETLR